MDKPEDNKEIAKYAEKLVCDAITAAKVTLHEIRSGDTSRMKSGKDPMNVEEATESVLERRGESQTDINIEEITDGVIQRITEQVEHHDSTYSLATIDSAIPNITADKSSANIAELPTDILTSNFYTQTSYGESEPSKVASESQLTDKDISELPEDIIDVQDPILGIVTKERQSPRVVPRVEGFSTHIITEIITDALRRIKLPHGVTSEDSSAKSSKDISGNESVRSDVPEIVKDTNIKEFSECIQSEALESLKDVLIMKEVANNILTQIIIRTENTVNESMAVNIIREVLERTMGIYHQQKFLSSQMLADVTQQIISKYESLEEQHKAELKKVTDEKDAIRNEYLMLKLNHLELTMKYKEAKSSLTHNITKADDCDKALTLSEIDVAKWRYRYEKMKTYYREQCQMYRTEIREMTESHSLTVKKLNNLVSYLEKKDDSTVDCSNKKGESRDLDALCLESTK